MKVLLLCLALFATFIYAQTCSRVICGAIGQSCAETYDSSGNLQATVQCTSSNTHCDDTSQKCVADIKVGGSCVSGNSECVSGSSCNGTTCVAYSTYADYQQACSTSTPCMSQWTCGSKGVCVGLSVGQTCGGSTSCNPPSYCSGDTGVCTVPGGEGAPCNIIGSYSSVDIGVSSEMCSNGLLCARTTSSDTVGTCQPVGSVRLGFYCDDDVQCPDSAACYKSCTAVTTTAISSGSGCTLSGQSGSGQSTSCPTGENCVCNKITGTGICQAYTSSRGNLPGTTASIKSVGSCAATSCPLVSQTCLLSVGSDCTSAEISCLSTKCAKQYCGFQAIALASGSYSLVPACLRPSIPDICKNAAVHVAVPVALIATFAAFLLL